MAFKNWLKAIGFGAAAATGTAEHPAEAAERMEQTPHVEVNRDPARIFTEAKQAVVDALNETTFDATSGGKLEGEGWTATVKETPGGLVAEITIASGTGPEKKEFDIRKDEAEDGKGNVKDVYSMNTGVDKKTEQTLAENETMLKAARGNVARIGGKPTSIASNDGSEAKK